jgi:V8-like Glu-specific endopeptidase
MGRARWRPIGLVATAATAVSAVVVLITSTGAAPGMAVSTTAAASTSATVGALFTRSTSGQLSNHFCTASVVDSPAGNMVVTAAHCVAGLAASQVAFVPDYNRGQQPYGVWFVTKIIADPQWRSASDPDDDFAFLIVSQPGSTVAVQSLTGGDALGIDESAGTRVTVSGYPDDGDALITCENATRTFSATQFEFDCTGFTDGTSGSPLIMATGPAGTGGTVIGVIGGYQKGGDTASVSYAARFGGQLAALYKTALAAAGTPG